MILHMLLFIFYFMVKFILKTQAYAPVFFASHFVKYVLLSIELTKVGKKSEDISSENTSFRNLSTT